MIDLQRDARVAAWLGGPVERAPEALLEATFERTRRSRQRPGLLAAMAGAPTMATRTAGRSPLPLAIVIALLLVIAIVALALVGALLPPKPRLAVAPTPPSTSSLASDRPGPTPAASQVPSIPAGATPFVVPGTLALFALNTSSSWAVAPGIDGVVVHLQTRITQTFDVVDIEWVTITASEMSLDEAAAALRNAGWTAEPEPIDAPLAGLIWNDGIRTPTALVDGPGFTYRLTIHEALQAGTGVERLRQFLGSFTPLGPRDPDHDYVDQAWHFGFVNVATQHAFSGPVQMPGGVTRFPGAGCSQPLAPDCDAFVDVVRLPNTSPLQLTLPDGRAVGLEIGDAIDYAPLAASWEREVGRSRGSSTEVWTMAEAWLVDNETMQGVFVHRGAQWLVLLSSEPPRAESQSVMARFLKGFVILR